MTMAFRKSSRPLFNTAAAIALGLQLAPLVTVSAQEQAPAALPAQTQARPINAQRRIERKQQRQAAHDPASKVTEPPVEPTGPAQPVFQPLPVPTATYNKSEVQRELEKLYQQNGRAVPEMVDARPSSAAASQTENTAPQSYAQPAPQQYQQPQYQPPQPLQQPAQAQPISQSTPTPPKKKGLLSKWFHLEDNSGPTQPPVEPAYNPPRNPQQAAPPAVVQQPAQAQPLMQAPAQPNSGRPNYGFLFQDEAQAPAMAQAVPQQPAVQAAPALVVPQTPVPAPQLNVLPAQPEVAAAPVPPSSEGFEAPLFVDDAPASQTKAPAQIPSLDFNAPIQEPASNQIELGNPAPLPGAANSVAQNAAQSVTPPTTPVRPVDPFSDDALFPTETPAAPAIPAQVAETPVEPVAPVDVGLSGEALQPADVATSQSQSVEPAAPAEQPTAESENPYSGLTLDTEPVSTPVLQTATPAPLTLPSANPLTNTTQTNELDREASPELVPPPREGALDSSTDSEPPLVVEEGSVPAKLTPVPHPGTETNRTQAKLEMIASRKGLKGLKGFCPVVLRDRRDLVDAESQFRVVYNERTYYLSSSDAVREFHSDPAKYAPAARGCDVIHLAITGEELEGSLDHAVWYKGRLYLFASAETMETFVASPSSHATLD